MAKIQAIGKTDLVRALMRSGSRTMSEESLEADIAAGAPVNEDGTINMVNYAAWILKGRFNGN